MCVCVCVCLHKFLLRKKEAKKYLFFFASLKVFKSIFSFCLTGCHTNLEDHSLFYFFP